MAPEIVTGAPAGWQARAIPGDRATKRYTCPGCNQTIPAGLPHVAAWREGHEEDRRHWHRACWERGRRSL